MWSSQLFFKYVLKPLDQNRVAFYSFKRCYTHCRKQAKLQPKRTLRQCIQLRLWNEFCVVWFNKGETKRPIWSPYPVFSLFFLLAFTIECVSILWRFCFPSMDALDTVANLRRQRPQKSLRQTKPKESCLFELVEYLGTQHVSAVQSCFQYDNRVFSDATDCLFVCSSLLPVSSASVQHACVTSLLNRAKWQHRKPKHQKLYNSHGLALRASLFLRTQERKQRLSLTQWGENKEMAEYEISSPPGEFTPQWYLLPHGPALSITHRHTPRVPGEGQAHAKSIGVWTFEKHCELNRFQGCGNRTINWFCLISVII